MNPILWTDEQVAQLQQLRDDKKTIAVIARSLDRSIHAIKAKIAKLKLPCEKRIARIERDRERRNDTFRSLRKKTDMCLCDGPRHIDAGLQAARQARLSAPYRDLTSAFFGDPPVGYSALEQRS